MTKSQYKRLTEEQFRKLVAVVNIDIRNRAGEEIKKGQRVYITRKYRGLSITELGKANPVSISRVSWTDLDLTGDKLYGGYSATNQTCKV